ncbi:MAG: hypothetical protein ABFE01_10225 [Phycisphaerales bacterium]
MIKKLYVDNFRCLVNFHLDMQANQLWLGVNGTGKSSVIDVLSKIQRVLDGDSVEDIFSVDDLTLWQNRETQTIGFTMTIDQDQYEYELTVQCDRNRRRCHIDKELLRWNGETFFRYEDSEAHLYRINSPTRKVAEGTHFGADWTRSVIPTIGERDDNAPLIRFRRSVQNKWLLVHPVPTLVDDIAAGEASRLLPYAQNFAQWYRHAIQENPEIAGDVFTALKCVLPKFTSLSLPEFGDARRLTARFSFGDIRFRNLSDGQRQLVMLHVILCSLKHNHSVLIIDEPDNFVALREIEPWLQGLRDLCQESCGRQAIVISHHPEAIDKMVDGSEILFYREEAGHTQTKLLPIIDGLTAAETMARGWENEQSIRSSRSV